MIEGESVVARLCAAGMAVDGDATAAAALFRQAWNSRRDRYEASVAAHFLARHQPTLLESLYWNQIAAESAEAVRDNRAKPLLASLYLNLGDSYLAVGRTADATAAADRGGAALHYLPPGGYRDFVCHGLQRLLARIARAGSPEPDQPES
jgi:hypothetical protein